MEKRNPKGESRAITISDYHTIGHLVVATGPRWQPLQELLQRQTHLKGWEECYHRPVVDPKRGCKSRVKWSIKGRGGGKFSILTVYSTHWHVYYITFVTRAHNLLYGTALESLLYISHKYV